MFNFYCALDNVHVINM